MSNAAEAKTRSWRTAIQGLIGTVVVAAATVVVAAVQGKTWDEVDWLATGGAALTAAVAAVSAWLMNYYRPTV